MTSTHTDLDTTTTIDITHAPHHISTPFFHSAGGVLTSAETAAHISEISCFLGLIVRWLRETHQRDLATRRDWAYSGGW